MAGLGNTIETDLVGEFVEVLGFEYGATTARVQARGRVRAAHLSSSGSFPVLWLEIVYEWDKNPWLRSSSKVEIGDVFAISLSDHNGERWLRILKHPEKSPWA